MPARTANVPFALRWCALYLMQFPTGLHVPANLRFLSHGNVRIDTNISLVANDKCVSLSAKFNPWIYLPFEFLSLILVLFLVSRFIFPSLEFYFNRLIIEKYKSDV